ncbi:MAG: porin [Bdellovibrionaceae bacterium]|nr:porin [Pseudobdellovibrionaceae bacterium]MDW8189602.1 porin [Pseudobdellovibrionaceae bacterium]
MRKIFGSYPIYIGVILTSLSLGNFWRLPFLVAQEGSGVFFFLFVTFLFFLGLPILISELIARQIVEKEFYLFQDKISRHKWFKILSFVPLLFSTIILLYYSILSSGVLHLFIQFLKKTLGFLQKSQFLEFAGFAQQHWKQLLFSSTHICIVFLWISADGKRGIKSALTILGPLALFVVFLLNITLFKELGIEGLVAHIFYPDFESFSWRSYLLAFGQVCFTLGLGLWLPGALAPKELGSRNIASFAFQNILVAMGISFFALIQMLGVAHVLSGSEAKNQFIFFQNLPTYFMEMDYGNLIGIVFYGAVYLVAVLSSLGLAESVVVNLERLLNWNRSFSLSALVGVLIVGVATLIFLSRWLEYSTMDLVLHIDFWVVNFGITIMAAFFSWLVAHWFSIERLKQLFVSEEIIETKAMFKYWYFLIHRFIPWATFIFIILFVFSSIAWAAGFQGRLQQRFEVTHPVGAEGVTSDLTIRRFRLKYQGEVPELQNVRYQVQLSFSRGDQSWEQLEFPNILRDAFFTWDRNADHQIHVGLRKLPGNRQRVISSGALEMTDRSLANGEFNLDRDVGFFSYHQWQRGTHVFRGQGALSSGLGRGTPSRSGTFLLASTLRLEWLPWGEFLKGGDYFEGDLLGEEDPKLSIGVVAHYNPNVVRHRGTVGWLLPSDVVRKMGTLIVDTLFKYRGFSYSHEIFYRSFNNENSGDPQIVLWSGYGYAVQASYSWAQRWLAALRYSHIQAVSGVNFLREETVFGLSYLVRHHRFKIQNEVSILSEESYYRFQVEFGF